MYSLPATPRQWYGYRRYKISCRFTLRDSLPDIITIQFVKTKTKTKGVGFPMYSGSHETGPTWCFGMSYI